MWGVCSYFKTQDGIVTLIVNISASSQIPALSDIVIGNLPEGFRPTGNVIAAAYAGGAGYIYLNYLGEVRAKGDKFVVAISCLCYILSIW